MEGTHGPGLEWKTEIEIWEPNRRLRLVEVRDRCRITKCAAEMQVVLRNQYHVAGLLPRLNDSMLLFAIPPEEAAAIESWFPCGAGFSLRGTSVPLPRRSG